MTLAYSKPISLLAACILASSSCLALAAKPHTTHTITSHGGTWHGKLVITSANQPGYFLDNNGQNHGNSWAFDLTSNQPTLHYGFGFNVGATFDISYSLNLYKGSSYANKLGFSSQACEFVVTAKGPAKPDVQVIPYNGAKCRVTDPDKTGVDFEVG